MKNEPEKPSHKILIAVAGTVIGGLILHFVTGISPLDVFHWVSEFAKASWLVSIEKVPTPKWLLGVFVVLSTFPIGWLVKKILDRGSEPSHWDYTEDCFNGVTWRWTYSINGGITNLWCYCAVCDTSLVYSEGEEPEFEYGRRRVCTKFVCERCGTTVATLEGTKDYILGRVLRQIDRAIRVGDWEKVVTQKRARDAKKG